MACMAHIPINHPLRPVYRVLSGLMGLYVLIFGIVGFGRTHDLDFFSRHGEWVFGLRTNPAFSVMSILGGAALVAAAIIGGNLFAYANLVAGGAFMLAGMYMLLVLQTAANILAASMVTCIASFIFAMIALTAGLYGKVGSAEDAHAENVFRHGETA
ncbi:MAG: hypothetical protein QOI74_462 [Micromonosporaceae bacterium]|jgi:hypothetical protein|nr:hypothetical protein [Micromonosporaceae bacterium]MDT5035372.1 hypothetical protein [Micromonosporaceae bacterium]